MPAPEARRPQLILASASPARRRVLTATGVEPTVVISDVDEDAVLAALDTGTAPEATVCALAAAKARMVAQTSAGHPDAVVVGCDSMLHLDGQLLGKPHVPEAAMDQWRRMRGRTAELLTGHHLIRVRDGAAPVEVSGTAGATIHFADVSDAVIEAYVATGEPLEVAGAFTLDGYGGFLVDGIDGDPSAVVGIGLPLVRRLLDEIGVGIADLWVSTTDER